MGPSIEQRNKKRFERECLRKLERETGFEPATLALARRCSTTELFPLSPDGRSGIVPATPRTVTPTICSDRSTEPGVRFLQTPRNRRLHRPARRPPRQAPYAHRDREGIALPSPPRTLSLSPQTSLRLLST